MTFLALDLFAGVVPTDREAPFFGAFDALAVDDRGGGACLA